jgi:hypothetical protein
VVAGTGAPIVRAQKRFGSIEAAQLDKLLSRSTELRGRHNDNKYKLSLINLTWGLLLECVNFWYVWPSGTVKTDRHSTAIPQPRRRLLYEKQGIGLRSTARC